MTEPRHDTWMPIYIGAYLKDTGRLKAAHHGAYLLLLIEAWTHEGLIPDDDDSLATITRQTLREWRAMKATILSFWKPAEGGYRQKRLDAEIVKAKGFIQQKSDAGKASAEARRLKREGNDRSAPVATETPTEELRESRPSPSPISDTNVSGAAAPSIDPEKKAWTDAVELLTSAGSMTQANARKFIGKLKADNGIEAKDLLPAIGQAIASQTQDPAAYLRKAAAGIGSRRGGGAPAPRNLIDDDEADLWPRRLAGWRESRTWVESLWGPMPGRQGCRVPAGMLEGGK